jgi:hypothetical protein
MTIPVSTLGAPGTQIPVSRTPRFENAGYYFGYDNHSRTWDLEKRLYEQDDFKTILLFVLGVTWVGLTVVGITL